MPFEKAMAVHRALAAAAQDALTSRNETRRIGELMADVLAERALGAPAPSLNVEVQLVMNERTLLRGSDESAYVPGYGPIPGFRARRLVVDATKVWIRRLYAAPETGELIAMESKRRTFPAGMRRAIIARDRTCRNPFCNAEIKHIDHRKPWAKRRKTELSNGDGLCERCNYIKTELGLRVDIITPRRVLRLVTPDGHTYEAEGTPLPGTGPATPTETLRQILDERRGIRGGGDPESA
ncbi:MAG: HNH endonuclease [Nocardiaceae bacterium]|nr:HNH endonuclease [Nocardiaceae bacterium]